MSNSFLYGGRLEDTIFILILRQRPRVGFEMSMSVSKEVRAVWVYVTYVGEEAIKYDRIARITEFKKKKKKEKMLTGNLVGQAFRLPGRSRATLGNGDGKKR